MSLQDPSRLFDVRTVQRHIKAGRTSEDALAAHLAALPDVSDKIRDRDEGGDEDGWEEDDEDDDLDDDDVPAASSSADEE